MATKEDDHTPQDSGDNDSVKFDNLPNFRRIRGTRVFRSSAPDSVTLQGQWLFLLLCTWLSHSTRSVVIFAPLHPTQSLYKVSGYFCSSAPNSITLQGQWLFCSSAPNSITLQGQWLFRSSVPDSLMLLLCTQLNHSTRSVFLFAPLYPTHSPYKVSIYFCSSAPNSITLQGQWLFLLR